LAAALWGRSQIGLAPGVPVLDSLLMLGCSEDLFYRRRNV
jgi:hypothetical protein